MRIRRRYDCLAIGGRDFFPDAVATARAKVQALCLALFPFDAVRVGIARGSLQNRLRAPHVREKSCQDNIASAVLARVGDVRALVPFVPGFHVDDPRAAFGTEGQQLQPPVDIRLSIPALDNQRLSSGHGAVVVSRAESGGLSENQRPADRAAPGINRVGPARPAGRFDEKRLDAEVGPESTPDIVKLCRVLRFGKGRGVEKDNRPAFNPCPLGRRDETVKITNRRVEPFFAEVRRQIDVIAGAAFVKAVPLENRSVVEKADSRRLMTFGLQQAVGLDQRRQASKTPAMVFSRHAPIHRHEKIDAGVHHIDELLLMPADPLIADCFHVGRMGRQGIRPITVDDVTFAVDIVPVEIGGTDNRLTLFERIGLLMIRLPQREKLAGRFLRQHIVRGGYRAAQTQNQHHSKIDHACCQKLILSESLYLLFESPAGRRRVARMSYGRADRNAPGAGVQHALDVVRRDSPYSGMTDTRSGKHLRRAGDILQANGARAGFCRRGKNGSQANISQALGAGGIELFERVRALADNQRGHLQLASLLNRQVILAKMHPIGTRGHGNINPVVNDTNDAGIFTNLNEFDGKSEKPVVLDVLGPKLDTIGTTGGTFVGQRNDFRRQVARNDNIQPDALEFRRSIAEKNDVLLKRISLVPQLFDCRGDGFIIDPDDLGKRPQGLGQTFAASGEAVGQTAASKLLFYLFADTDVPKRVPAGNEPAGIKPTDRRREFVPELLGSFGQWARIQNEPAELLYYARSLTGTIEIGIDNSISRMFHNETDYMSEERL